LNIDKNQFIELVFNTKPTDNKIKVNQTLFLNEPYLLNLTKYVDNNDNKNYLLSYKLYENQYKNHKIISEPYLQLLHIYYSNTDVMLNKIKIHPVVTKYADILIHEVFKNLNTKNKEIVKHTNSTLIILNQFIRPFIKDEPSTIELFILYQIMLPMIYDTNGNYEYIDVFL